ncbi:organic cation/carnitine transporter 3 [Prunus dulcis]|uniref:Organic cation/carnitine transporter 3 n=1 Tax=Prunus dulcis TaxID=3755 RepID=A0A4Y1RDZ9_PRUDU|nr:organic cation/carnitine transporter 3 [Prunus dulcis]
MLLSGVSTGPIRGVGCTGVWGDIVYDVEVPRGVGYPALRQTPYVALVVPAYGEICDSMAWSHVA